LAWLSVGFMPRSVNHVIEKESCNQTAGLPPSRQGRESSASGGGKPSGFFVDVVSGFSRTPPKFRLKAGAAKLVSQG